MKKTLGGKKDEHKQNRMEELTTSAMLDMRATNRKVMEAADDLTRSVGSNSHRSLPIEIEDSRDGPLPPVPPMRDMPFLETESVLNPHLVQLGKWRKKASLMGTLGFTPGALEVSAPGLEEPFDPLTEARRYYQKCWLLLHCHGSSFPLHEVAETYAELAMFLRLSHQISSCLLVSADCLTMDGSNAAAMEMIDWGLLELKEPWTMKHLTVKQQTEVCVALGKIRVGYDDTEDGAKREKDTAELLDAFGDASTEAGKARLAWIAARASRFQGEKKQIWLDKLLEATRAKGPLSTFAAELVTTCGDLTIVVQGDDETVTVQACRMALAESSDYFSRLLSGQFREASSETVTVQTQFAICFRDVILPYLYRGGRLEEPLKDYDVAVQVLSIATQFEFAQLKRASTDLLAAGLRQGLLELGETTASFVWIMSQGNPVFQKAVIDGWCSSLRGALDEGRHEAFVELLGTSDGNMRLALDEGQYVTQLDTVINHRAHSAYTLFAVTAQFGSHVSRMGLTVALRMASENDWTDVIDCAISKSIITPTVLSLLGPLKPEHKLLVLEATSSEEHVVSAGISSDKGKDDAPADASSDEVDAVALIKVLGDYISKQQGETDETPVNREYSLRGVPVFSLPGYLDNVQNSDQLLRIWRQLERLRCVDQHFSTAISMAIRFCDPDVFHHVCAAVDPHETQLPDNILFTAIESGSLVMVETVANFVETSHALMQVGQLQFAAVLSGQRILPATPQAPEKPVLGWRRASVAPAPWQPSLDNTPCPQCKIVQGHLTTCPQFAARRNASASSSSTNAPPSSPQCPACGMLTAHLAGCSKKFSFPLGTNNVKVPKSLTPVFAKVQRSITAEEAYAAAMSEGTFPDIQFARTPIVHAILQMNKDEVDTCAMVECLLRLHCVTTNVSAPGPLEASAWRGFSSVCELLLQAGAQPQILSPLGWNALHIAAHRGFVKIVELLVDVAPCDFEENTWLGKRKISLSQVIETGASDEMKAWLRARELSDLRISSLQTKTSPRLSPDTEVGDIRTAQLVKLTQSREHTPNNNNPPVGPHEPAPKVSPAEPPERVICSGPLLKFIKVSFLRKVQETRFVTLLMKMLPTGSVYMLRESTADFDSFYEKKIVGCNLKAHTVTFDLEGEETVAYLLDRLNEDEWTPHIKGIRGSTTAQRERSASIATLRSSLQNLGHH